MDYLPIFVDLRGRACLVVGGGALALRKLELLQRAGAAVRVVSPELCAPLAARAQSGELQVALRDYAAGDLDGVCLVIAATDRGEVNACVAADAQARAIPVNVVDSPRLCSFVMPAIVDRSPLLVAVSSAGASPVLARLTRARLELALPAQLGALARFAARHRAQVRARVADTTARRRLWEQLLDDAGEVAALLYAGREAEAEARLLRALDAGQLPPGPAVALLAAGHGDPDCLSRAAARWLGHADLVLHEPGVPAALLELTRRDAEKAALGASEAPGSGAQLLEAIRSRTDAGMRVCVVRQGDPYAGDASEEPAALRRAGIRVVVLRPAPPSA